MAPPLAKHLSFYTNIILVCDIIYNSIVLTYNHIENIDSILLLLITLISSIYIIYSFVLLYNNDDTHIKYMYHIQLTFLCFTIICSIMTLMFPENYKLDITLPIYISMCLVVIIYFTFYGFLFLVHLLVTIITCNGHCSKLFSSNENKSQKLQLQPLLPVTT